MNRRNRSIALFCRTATLATLLVAAVAPLGALAAGTGGGAAEQLAAAAAALQQGAPESAAALATKAIALAPAEPEAYYTLGLAQQALSRDSEAEEALWKAVQLRPATARYHYALGLSYTRNGKENLALAEFQQVIKLEPGNAAGQFQVGQILYDQGEPEAAVRYWEAALSVSPGFPPALKALGAYYQGQGRLDQAIDLLNRATQEGALDADLWARLGDALLARNKPGDAEDAVYCFRQFRVLAPPGTDQAALARADELLTRNADWAATRLLARGISATDQEQAALLFRRAAELSPGLAQAHYNLGLALQRLGRYAEAVGAYAQAAALAPDQAIVHANLG
ncbi:MAG: tetratricopeptide repeat protein, partial [Chitinophagales bacterium]